jgi:lipid II:glycine glycyltransferase (peptidoglycan interpeptide bridge formation enzyme)
MAKLTLKNIASKEVWEKFVLSYEGSNFLQSWNWGEFHQSLGKDIKRVGFYHDKKLLGVMLAVVEKARRATYLTVPGGPLIDWGNKTLVKAWKLSLNDIGTEFGCSFIRVRPQLLETDKNGDLFRKLAFKNAPMHLHAELTRQLDLTKSEEQLWQEMRKTTRNEIKQAIKLEIKITQSTSLKDIDSFYNLQIETAKRQGFVGFSKAYLKEQFKIFSKDNQVILYTALFGKKKLAQAFVIFYAGEAAYHFGASTSWGRKYPGAYLIQWEAIKEAQRRGLKRYNFWGVAPEGETSHRFHGVSVFKRGFGGDDVAYMHARDLVIKPLQYRINWLIESARKRLRKV